MKTLNITMECTVVIIVFVMSILAIIGGIDTIKKCDGVYKYFIGALQLLFGLLLLMLTITLSNLI